MEDSLETHSLSLGMAASGENPFSAFAHCSARPVDYPGILALAMVLKK